MATKSKKQQRKVKVGQLPKSTKKLAAKELKNIKGGTLNRGLTDTVTASVGGRANTVGGARGA